MGHRSKVALALFAIGFIGFILGAAANIIYSKALPLLLKTFPEIFVSEWMLWGACRRPPSSLMLPNLRLLNVIFKVTPYLQLEASKEVGDFLQLLKNFI